MTWLKHRISLVVLILVLPTTSAFCQTAFVDICLFDSFNNGWDAFSQFGLGTQDGYARIYDDQGNLVHDMDFTNGSQECNYDIELAYGCYVLEIGLDFNSLECSWYAFSSEPDALIADGFGFGLGDYGPYTYNFCLGPSGCTDPVACNYDPAAFDNDGSCCYGECATVTLSDGIFDNMSATISEFGGPMVGSIPEPGSIDVCLDGCYVISVYNESFDFPQPASVSVVDGDGNLITIESLSIPPGATDSFVFGVNHSLVTFSVSDGTWPSEVSWELLDSDDNVVSSGGSGYEEDMCLPNDCYKVRMIDSYGDGWNGAEWSFEDYDGNINISGTLESGFEAIASASIGTEGVCGCTDIEACNYDPDATIDDGTCLPGSPTENNCEDAINYPPFDDGTTDNFSVLNIELGPNCLNQSNVPISCGAGAFPANWISFVCLDGEYEISTILDGTLTDTRLAVFDACGGNEIACNDDVDLPGGDLSSSIYLTCSDLTIGNTYYIAAGSYNGLGGTYSVQVTRHVGVCGCMDTNACNYYPNATFDDGSCLDPGCLEPLACNYDLSAPCGGGFCELPLPNDYCQTAFDITFAIDGPTIIGDNSGSCADPEAIPSSCQADLVLLESNLVWFSFTPETGIHVLVEPDPTTFNTAFLVFEDCANPEPIFCGMAPEDLSCQLLDAGQTYYMAVGEGILGTPGEFEITLTSTSLCGCMDETACNYDPEATLFDNSCEYSSGCTDPIACNYASWAGCDNGSCTYPGCNDPSASNYDATAGCDNESCFYLGCTYVNADNFNSGATVDDGSCTFSPSTGCQGDFNGDNEINTTDLLGFLSVFGTTCNP